MVEKQNQFSKENLRRQLKKNYGKNRKNQKEVERKVDIIEDDQKKILKEEGRKKIWKEELID